MSRKCIVIVVLALTLSLSKNAPAEIEGTMDSNGWWMRPGGATYEEWFYSVDKATMHDFTITINLLVTNQVNGGSGYSTAVEVKVINPDTGANQVFGQVWLQNSDPCARSDHNQTPVYLYGTDPEYSYGHGYPATGSISAVSNGLISAGGTLKVRIERIPTYQVQDAFGVWYPHVGGYPESEKGVTLSPGAGPPAGNQPPVADVNPTVVDSDVRIQERYFPPPVDLKVIYIWAKCPQGQTVEVTLDGSQSYDPEGADLDYTWSWDGNISKAATLEESLPVGNHEYSFEVSEMTGPFPWLTDEVYIYIYISEHVPEVTIRSITPDTIHEGDWLVPINFDGFAKCTDHGIKEGKWYIGDYTLQSCLCPAPFPETAESEPDFLKNLNDCKDDLFVSDEWAKLQNPPQGNTVYFETTCGAEATAKTTAMLYVSEKPTLSFVSSVGPDDFVDVVVDGTRYNVKAHIEANFKNKLVALNWLDLDLYNGEDEWLSDADRLQDIQARQRKYVDLYHYFKWCPERCDEPPDSPDVVKSRTYQVRATVEDENGYTFMLEAPSMEYHLRVPSNKWTYYETAWKEYDNAMTAKADLDELIDEGAPQWLIDLRYKAYCTHFDDSRFYCDLAWDPWEPDPNYQQEVSVFIPVIDFGLVCEQDCDECGKCWDSGCDTLGLRGSTDALYTTIPKMLGAAEVWDEPWLRIHCADALRFGVWVAEDFEELAHSQNEVRKLLTSVTAQGIAEVQNEVETAGFRAQEIAIFQQLGLTQADINDLREKVIATDPQKLADELQVDREERIRRLGRTFSGLPRSEWPWERFAIAITSPRERNYVRGQVNVEVTGWNNIVYEMPAFITVVDINGVRQGGHLLWYGTLHRLMMACVR
jgi:hypothetical protein